MRSRGRAIACLILSLGSGLAAPLLHAGDPADRRSPGPGTVVAGAQQVIRPSLFAAGSLIVTPTVVSFEATNPSTKPLVAGNSPVEVNIAITGAQPSHSWTLTVAVQSPTLSSPNATIPVDAMMWTSACQLLSGDGTADNMGSPQRLSSSDRLVARGSQGTKDTFQARVTVNFNFLDSWSYPVGTYSQTVFFTLTAP